LSLGQDPVDADAPHHGVFQAGQFHAEGADNSLLKLDVHLEGDPLGFDRIRGPKAQPHWTLQGEHELSRPFHLEERILCVTIPTQCSIQRKPLKPSTPK
jgi:hypothetical protein